MPWTDQPGLAPQRSEAELYAAVQQRAAAIRRRRRAGWTAGLGGAVAMLLVAFALVRADDDSASALRVVGDVATSTTSTAVVPTSAMILPSTTLPQPAPETSTTRPRTAVTSTTRTTLRPSPATPAAPTPTTASTTPPPLRMCDPADVLITATPDRPSYPVGATVNVVVTGLNRSARACQPMDPVVDIRDAAGAGVGGIGVTDIFTMSIAGQPQPSWDPGETLSATMPVVSIRCGEANAVCPPGTYFATAKFGPFQSAPAPFTFTLP